MPSACRLFARNARASISTFSVSARRSVEDELHREFPEARIARMDRDTVSGKRHFETILTGFRERAFDILVGTQMIAKGHDIPNVTLVGVISADIGLGMPDFRAAERTFQLLTQVAGRAGRGELPGQVLVQTINPDHYAIRHAAAQDFTAFYNQEIHFRKAMRYPPFSALANVLVRSEKQEDAMRMSSGDRASVDASAGEHQSAGAGGSSGSATQERISISIADQGKDRRALNDTLRLLRSHALDRKWNATALVIDVDPLTLL